jgi:hypothetical protein
MGVRHGVQVHPPLPARKPPLRLGVALDHLAQAMNDRLQQVVARGQPFEPSANVG